MMNERQLNFLTLTMFAAVHTMIVEQDEEDSEAVKIIKKDIPAEYGVLIQKFRLIDNTFFNVCFDNYVEGMQLLLRIFLGRDDLVVKHVVTQQSADNLYGRGVRFDVLAEDSEGKFYDCEVQRVNEGATPRRARYNSSMMDSRELAKGAEFAALPETWVIFITENDIYGVGYPLYHVERIVQELQRPFDAWRGDHRRARNAVRGKGRGRSAESRADHVCRTHAEHPRGGGRTRAVVGGDSEWLAIKRFTKTCVTMRGGGNVHICDAGCYHRSV